MAQQLEVAAVNLKRVAGEIREALTCKGMLILYFWSLIVVSIISGIVRGNVFVFIGFVVGICAFVVFASLYPAMGFLQFLGMWLLDGRNRSDAFDEAFERGEYERPYRSTPPLSRSDMFILLFFTAFPFVSSLVLYCAPHGGQYAIVGSSVLPIDASYAITQPFSKVTWVDAHQKIVSEELTAKTADGATVTATVTADLRLKSRSDALAFADRQDEIRETINRRLAVAFREVVGTYTVKTLPGDLLVLSELVHQKSLGLLAGIPLTWSGEFSVSKPKLVVRQ